MTPRVSIIVPCYNQGAFLKETLKSVLDCDASIYELIIVNDGSTDSQTNEYLRQLKIEGYQVIFQENKGLAGARNAALEMAKGEFILPLDSDNKIRPAYISEAILAMDADPAVAVVYANAQYFGDRSGVWLPGRFNMQRLMLSNYIDACAMIRKSVLDKLGHYDTKMKYMGWEDWDLWLRISFAGYKFFYLDKLLWDYRIVADSMSKKVYNAYEKPNTLENYINDKYPDRMGQEYVTEHTIKRFKQNPFLYLIKLFIRAYFPGYYSKLLKRNKIRNGL